MLALITCDSVFKSSKQLVRVYLVSTRVDSHYNTLHAPTHAQIWVEVISPVLKWWMQKKTKKKLN